MNHRHPHINVRLMLLLMVFVCGLVSAYDNLLNLITMDCLEELEQNPVALQLIKLCGVPSLIYVKALTTMVAVFIMVRLVYTKWWITILPVFIFQLWLFSYLTFHTNDKFAGEDTFEVAGMVLKLLGEIYI